MIFEPIPLQQLAEGVEEEIESSLLRLEDSLGFLSFYSDARQKLLYLCTAFSKGPAEQRCSLGSKLSRSRSASMI